MLREDEFNEFKKTSGISRRFSLSLFSDQSISMLSMIASISGSSIA